MRWFLIHPGLAETGPWVLAESPDQDWAESVSWSSTTCLSRDDALADPAYGSAVLAWENNDDHAYSAWVAVEDAALAAGAAE